MKLRYKFAGILLAVGAMVGVAAPASANELPPPAIADQAKGEDCSSFAKFLGGNGGCKVTDLVLGTKKAPIPQSPTSDITDYFTSLRPTNAPTGSPFDQGGPTMFASSGLGGFLVSNYDLPGTDDVVGSAEAVGQTSTANFIESISVSITGATALLERYAYNPTELTSFLAEFTQQAMSVVRLKVWLPWIGIGLLLATIVTLGSSAVRGRTRDTLWAVAWSVIILTVAAILMGNAVMLQRTGTEAVTSTLGELNTTVSVPGRTGEPVNDNLSAYGQNSHGIVVANPNAMSDAMTDAQLRQVHFQGWCRREFGSTSTQIVKDYCAKMWDAQRYTYVEQYQIDRDTTGDVKKNIKNGKAENWNRWAAEIQTKDPDAYSCMQGIGCNRVWNALTELGFTVATSLFRIATALLILIAGAAFLGYAVAFVVTSPYTVVAKLGQGLAMDLLGGMVKGFVYALAAGVCSWLFMLWAQLALSPGISTFWSFVLMCLGVFIGFGVLNPFRKIMHVATFGKVKSQGKFGLHLLDRALTLAAGKSIADSAAEKVGFTPRDDRPAGQQYTSPPSEWSENFRHAPTSSFVPPVFDAPAIGYVHEGTVIDREASVAPVNTEHSPDVYEPQVIPGEVIDSNFFPETDDFDGTTDIDIYDPSRQDSEANA